MALTLLPPQSPRFGTRRAAMRALISEHKRTQRLYVLSHDMLGGRVKIGRSYDPERRARGMAATLGLPPFEVAWHSDLMLNAARLEGEAWCRLNEWHAPLQVQSKLASKGHSEFFKLPVADAVRIAQEIVAEMGVPA